MARSLSAWSPTWCWPYALARLSAKQDTLISISPSRSERVAPSDATGARDRLAARKGSHRPLEEAWDPDRYRAGVSRS